MRKYNKIYISLILIITLLFSIVAAMPFKDKENKTYNIAPKIDLSAVPKKKLVDIVIMTDYTGTKLQSLQDEITKLEGKFYTVNVEPRFTIINDMKKVGTQTDSMYTWYRSAGLNIRWSQYTNYSGAFKAPYYEDNRILWEETQALESKLSTLPKRSPANIRYTRGSTQQYWSSYDTYREYFDYTLYCSNDVKSSDTGSVTIQYVDSKGLGYDKQGIESITPYVSTSWEKGNKLYDLNYDVYSLDFSKLTTTALRTGSDRYIMFISDASKKDFSQPRGSYFCFGDLTEEVGQYIKNNNFTAIGVVPEGIQDMWMLSDKVTEIEPFINYTNFKLIDGTWKKIGGFEYNSLPAGTLAYPTDATNVENIKNIKKRIGNFTLFKNGTLKYYDQESDTFTNIPKKPANIPFDNVADIYSYENNISVINIELSTGEVYLYYSHDSFEPVKKLSFMSGFKKQFNNYVLDKAGNLFTYSLDSESVYNYGQYPGYNYGDYVGTKYTLTGVKQITQKLRYDNNGIPYPSPLPSKIKDIQSDYVLFNDGSLVNTYIISRYEGKNGDIQVFYFIDWNNNAWYPHLKVIDTNVKEINMIDTFIFYKHTNDTDNDNYKYAGRWSYKYNCRYNEDKDTYRCDTGSNEKNPTPSDIKTIINLQPYGYSAYNVIFAVDTNNNLLMFTSATKTSSDAILNFHQTGISDDIAGIYYIPAKQSYYNYESILIKTKSEKSYILTYNRLDNGYYQVRQLQQIEKNIRYVKTTPNRQTMYVVYEDGTVAGYGDSYLGQLGIKTDRKSYERDPFVNTFTLTDKTKKYNTLNSLFKGDLENKFYPTGQYAAALNDIYKKYENFSSTGSMYILLDEEIEYIPGIYEDYERDSEHERKWLINHSPNYFDNSMGISQYHNPTGIPTSPPSKFDKVGKYIINLRVRDNPKNDLRFKIDTEDEIVEEEFNYYKWSVGNQNLTLYVHRKPIALMNVSATQNANETYKIIAMDGGSYDLDHTSRTDKGIIAWQWAWRDQYEDSWHYERMNKLDATGDRAYIIALRVQDMEGVWSDWIYQTIDNRQPPIAKFDIIKNPITSVELAQIKDTSYAIMSNLTNWHWVVKKINDNGTIGSTLQEIKPTSSNTGAGGYDTSLNLTRTNPGVGKYRIYLRVKADNGLWSDGGTDAVSNINNMFYRDLTVNQVLKIDDIAITGRWNHFRGWTDKFGVWKDVMKDTTYVDEKSISKYPYRFLSYEKIDIKIKLEGYADEVAIDFPVNTGSGYSLGSMNYRDKLGHEYSYQEDLGYIVNFPYKGPYKTPLNPAQKDPTIEWSYILPLVHSSASWENVRLYQPYEIKITAKKGSYEVTQTKKIDITGNVDDLIFIQPVER